MLFETSMFDCRCQVENEIIRYICEFNMPSVMDSENLT